MKNLSKHFQAITKAKHLASRPALQGIHYNPAADQLEVCDSHRLLTYKVEYSQPEEYTFNPETLQRIEGNYPDTARLIPEAHTTTFCLSEINPTLIKIIAAFKKENVLLHIQERQLLIKQENGNIIQSIELTYTDHREYEETCVNGQFLSDALAFLSDYSKHAHHEEIIITMTSAVRPITFSTPTFNYLITPIRRS